MFRRVLGRIIRILRGKIEVPGLIIRVLRGKMAVQGGPGANHTYFTRLNGCPRGSLGELYVFYEVKWLSRRVPGRIIRILRDKMAVQRGPKVKP